MFDTHLIPVPAVLADEPVEMPINILLALPEYITGLSNQHVFNVPAAINELMGSSGWRVATQVLKPRVWAPGWNEEQLRAFAAGPFGKKERALPASALRGLRARAFPGLQSLANTDKWNYPQYEIIHFVGRPEKYSGGLELGGADRITFGRFTDALAAARTRLLILQLPLEVNDNSRRFNEEDAARLARRVAGSGGPAVLVVSGGTQEVLDGYFLDLYAAIIHNSPLTYAARPGEERDLSVQLFHGEGGDESLRFEGFREMTYDRLRALRGRTVGQVWADSLNSPLVQAAGYGQEVGIVHMTPPPVASERVPELLRPYLHQAQVESFKSDIAATRATFEEGAQLIHRRAEELTRELDWTRETGGAIPLSEAALNLPSLELQMDRLREGFSQEVTAKALEAASRAPRVLNANFADPRLEGPLAGRALPPGRGMEAGQEYELYVDVGPRWSGVTSIVGGNKNFPEAALPATEQGGHVVQVVFVSEDFTPSLSSAQMWVPSRTGRSSPLVNGERAERPGPVSLRLRAPAFPVGANDDYVEARGRLCLYYGNNLLQSAAVKAVVARPGAQPQFENVSNEIYVDFSLTGNFQEVEQFTTRRVALDERAERDWLLGSPAQGREGGATAEGAGRGLAVGLSLTMNDDGSKHRILVKSEDGLPPVWKPYNVTGTAKLLSQARKELYNCFFPRDPQTCQATVAGGAFPTGLNSRGGKDYYQFFCDLRQLAIFGEMLFNVIYQQVSLDGTGINRAEWEAGLRRALGRATVIQVARTGEAEYAFPWALVYQYPLDDKDNLRVCDVIGEWDADGLRSKEAEERCPYEDEPWHDRNILCIYGFWGLKHYIEQPIPPLSKESDGGGYALPGNVARTIDAAPSLNISVAVTRDPQLSPSKIKEHLTNLAKLSSLNPPDGADEWTRVQSVLKSPGVSPEIIYFLCHGEYDDIRCQPYLGIGLPSGLARHRVYPNDLISWSRNPQTGWPVWQKPRPLVFINGCHTFALLPDQILNFVSTFAEFGASGVIGTEVSVLLPLATEIAELLVDAFVNAGMTLGQAMRQVRWKLANKGNLLGLAYTPYGQADLRLVRST